MSFYYSPLITPSGNLNTGEAVSLGISLEDASTPGSISKSPDVIGRIKLVVKLRY